MGIWNNFPREHNLPNLFGWLQVFHKTSAYRAKNFPHVIMIKKFPYTLEQFPQ